MMYSRSGGDNHGIASALPVVPTLSTRVQQRLLDKVMNNRVTIVVGPTGSGKSTLVPSFLLDALSAKGALGSVLCSQPRRLAVVSLAQRVAQMRQDPTEVGYHVGQHNASTSDTRLLFATAGILLEELRSSNGGIYVLEKYDCIILDECHERSVESDLCLAVIKQLLKTHPTTKTRLVLMSATFDHAKYRKYFETVPGCDAIDLITLETAESYETFHNQVETLYLEDFLGRLPNKMRYWELHRTMRTNPDMDLYHHQSSNRNMTGRDLSHELLDLISGLIQYLDDTEPENAVFLVFAPTYRHLEQCYECLMKKWYNESDDDSYDECPNSELMLAVLHSSVDIEDCLRSMQQQQQQNQEEGTRRRRVLLASSIAESSVTIPGVTCVIDTCRSLQVSWDPKTEKHQSRTVWSSQSICDQRQGRTGRTCAGRVFRLIPKNFFLSSLEPFETPALQGSDCRNEVLALISASSSEINESLLYQTLDPPAAEVVSDATQYLKDVNAVIQTKGQRAKLISSDYGNILADLPFQVAESQAILAAAQHGYLYEMILYQILKTIRPSPIKTYFGDEYSCIEALVHYNDPMNIKNQTDVMMANMSAFMYWDHEWMSARKCSEMDIFYTCSGSSGRKPKQSFLCQRLQRNEIERRGELSDCGTWSTMSNNVEQAHLDWCQKHQINPTSVRSVAETMDITIKILFRSKHEPEWLKCCRHEPVWRRPDAWKYPNMATLQMMKRVYGPETGKKVCDRLQELSMVSPEPTTLDTLSKLGRMILSPLGNDDDEGEACVHYLSGNCKYGSNCRKSHSPLAKRPKCRFFLSGRCTKGENCVYSHDTNCQVITASKIQADPLKPLVPLLKSLDVEGGALGWYERCADSLLLFENGNYNFSRSLSLLGIKPSFAVDVQNSSIATRSRFDVTRIHAQPALAKHQSFHHCAWNFPSAGSEEDKAANEQLILGTFMSLALWFSHHVIMTTPKPQFALTLQGDQFSRWSVLRSARYSSWNLKSWCNFDHEEFPLFISPGTPANGLASGYPRHIKDARFYVFELDHSVV